jgi:hypothetical protein
MSTPLHLFITICLYVKFITLPIIYLTSFKYINHRHQYHHHQHYHHLSSSHLSKETLSLKASINYNDLLNIRLGDLELYSLTDSKQKEKYHNLWDWDQILELLLTNITVTNTMNTLKASNRFEYIWFNKFLTEFNSVQSDKNNVRSIDDDNDNVVAVTKRTEFNDMIHQLLDKDVERLCLFKESIDNPKLSVTMRININPVNIAQRLMTVKRNSFQG